MERENQNHRLPQTSKSDVEQKSILKISRELSVEILFDFIGAVQKSISSRIAEFGRYGGGGRDCY